MKRLIIFSLLVILCFGIISCNKEDSNDSSPNKSETEWKRDSKNPVLRDLIPSENYQVASDAHVFYDNNGKLNMVYTGDFKGVSSIKLASGSSFNNWKVEIPLLFEIGPSTKDINKETPFYRMSSNGKHQIYYIGYEDIDTYEAEIYLAEADELQGPYVQMSNPIVPRGNLAGEEVYTFTSPSIVEHEELLYITFIGWDASPNNVTKIWVIGATSNDEGHTWSDFKKVNVPIGAEGQITKIAESQYVAVRTDSYQEKEAIFYATAKHPFGPWSEFPKPILVQVGAPFEVNEIIAPQILKNNANNKEYLYYTGADYQVGWWIMLAEKEEG